MCAWGLAWDDGATDHQEVDLSCDPRLAPERIRAAVLEMLVQRMGQRARAAGYPSIVALAGCIDGDVVYAQTLRACGFAHVRTFHHLRIDLDDEPIATTPPVGLDIATFTPRTRRRPRAAGPLLRGLPERRRTFVRLGVDTGNTTGSQSLYESVGMRPERVIHAYQREVLPEPRPTAIPRLPPEHSHEAARTESVPSEALQAPWLLPGLSGGA